MDKSLQNQARGSWKGEGRSQEYQAQREVEACVGKGVIRDVFLEEVSLN